MTKVYTLREARSWKMQSQQINKRSILFAQGEKRKMSKNKRFYLFSRSDPLFSCVFDYQQLY